MAHREPQCAGAARRADLRTSQVRPFTQGLFASLSIGAGYLPVAFSFGLAALQAQLSPPVALLVSVLVYAGASQFALVALVAAGGSLLSVVATVALMNVRHVFYGPVILGKLRGDAHPGSGAADGAGQTSGAQGLGVPLPLLAFGLTDEVFARAVGGLPAVPLAGRPYWFAGLELGAYASWLLGTALGATLGQQMLAQSVFLREVLAFILPALFFALLLEIMPGTRRRVLWGAGLATAALASVLPAYLAMVGGMLAGAALGYSKKSA
ncbi:MAG: AzlC family ABC transporter permease [Pseudomonadota bacterium]